jgi:ribose transport system permease protein
MHPPSRRRPIMAERALPALQEERRGFRVATRLLASQAFWVTLATLIIVVGMMAISDAFASYKNVFNTTRNFAFIGIMALGQVVVIITGGIDLAVGSVMGLSGIVFGMAMAAGHSLWASAALGLAVALAAGAVNGYLIAYLGLSPFVVTLGMLSVARSLALVVSNNQMVYQFGPDEQLLFALGGGETLGVANPVLILVGLTLVFGFLLNFTVWGRHIYAVGGNPQAARLTGLAVERIKLSAYLLSALTAGIAAILTIGWLGSVTNALGLTYELRVIAASVIGGANLLGGEGTAYGALIGSALLEIIRNSLLLAGVDPYWQGTFIGLFIVLAVLLERIRGRRSA